MNLKDFFLKTHNFNTQPSTQRALARVPRTGGVSALAVAPEAEGLINTMRQMSSWTPSASKLSGVANPLLEAADNADWLWKNIGTNYLTNMGKLL